MSVSGVKFEEHCFNISRDICDWVLYCFSRTSYGVITFFICITQKRKHLHTKKDLPKRKTAFFTLKSLWKAIAFYFIGVFSMLYCCYGNLLCHENNTNEQWEGNFLTPGLYNDTLKSKSWNVLETVLSHLKICCRGENAYFTSGDHSIAIPSGEGMLVHHSLPLPPP